MPGGPSWARKGTCRQLLDGLVGDSEQLRRRVNAKGPGSSIRSSSARRFRQPAPWIDRRHRMAQRQCDELEITVIPVGVAAWLVKAGARLGRGRSPRRNVTGGGTPGFGSQTISACLGASWSTPSLRESFLSATDELRSSRRCSCTAAKKALIRSPRRRVQALCQALLARPLLRSNPKIYDQFKLGRRLNWELSRSFAS